MAIGFGIVGCGMIANFHARAIADIRGATLVAAVLRRFGAVADAEGHRAAAAVGVRLLAAHCVSGDAGTVGQAGDLVLAAIALSVAAAVL